MPPEAQSALMDQEPVQAPGQGGRTFRISLLASVFAIAALAPAAWHYRRFIADDAFISLRYAERFLQGHGLTWNDGEIVEGYTNLLWVLACALLGKLGLPLVWAPRVLGWAGMTASIAAILWVYRAPTIRGALPGFVAAIGFALCGPVVVWTVGGLEQPLLTGLLAWAIALSYPLIEDAPVQARTPLLPGLFFGLAALTRADGILFTFAAVLGIIVARGLRRESLRTCALLILVPLLLFAGQLVFRRAYYHEWLPNSAFAKVGFSTARIKTGLMYVVGSLYMIGLLIPAIIAPFVARSPIVRGWTRFLGIILVAWLAYLTLVGGDQFPGRRQLVPAALLFAFLTAVTFQSLIASRASLGGPVAAAALSFLTLGVCQIVDPKDIWAYTESWPWDGKPVGKLLATAFGSKHAVLAVDSGGCMPYFSGLPSVDMLGINDSYLAHHHPADFGYGPLGHELGSGPYVLSKKPDLVLFNLPTGGLYPRFRSGKEMLADPRGEFASTFVPVEIECEPPQRIVSIIWMRTEGGAVGAQTSSDRMEIPGYLFATPGRARARLGLDGRLTTALLPGAGVELPTLLVPPGQWDVRIENTGGPVALSIVDPATDGFLTSSGNGSRFSIDGSAPKAVKVILWAQDPAGAQLRDVVLERADKTSASAPD